MSTPCPIRWIATKGAAHVSPGESGPSRGYGLATRTLGGASRARARTRAIAPTLTVP